MVLFLIDGKVGAQNIDLEIANRLRKMDKKVLLVANKVDNQKDEADLPLLNRLGLGEPVPVSGLNGINIGELLDLIAQSLPEEGAKEEIGESIKVAVIGRPNVGKSSFVNSLLGEEKLIVTESPGTTRDSIDTDVEINGITYTLIDTAGLRRKSKIENGIEYYTSLRTLRSIQRCDVALTLIEAQVGLVNQDIKIIGEVDDLKKGMVIGVNKWDLLEKDDKTADYYTKRIKREAPFLDHVPLIYISAKTKQRVGTTLNLINQVYNERKKRIDTSQLNDKLGKEIQRKPPASVKGRYVKIYYCTQTDVEPPTFVFFCNYPELLQKSYLRYLENKIREHFGFMGTPIRMKIKRRE
jgi:GTP-binding protein